MLQEAGGKILKTWRTRDEGHRYEALIQDFCLREMENGEENLYLNKRLMPA